MGPSILPTISSWLAAMGTVMLADFHRMLEGRMFFISSMVFRACCPCISHSFKSLACILAR